MLYCNSQSIGFLHLILLVASRTTTTTQGFTIFQHHASKSILTRTTGMKTTFRSATYRSTTRNLVLLQQSSSRRSTPTNSSDNNSSNHYGSTPPSTTTQRKNKQKQQQQQKKRRFAQDVKPIVTIPTPPVSRASRKSDNDLGLQQQQSKGNSIKNSSSNISGRNPKNNDVLQKSKSIEDLENIMSNRWGTRLEKWAADFDEWEVVYDNDDTNDGGSTNNNNNNFDNKSIKSGRKMKSKPVLNPWDKEERQKIYNERLEEKKKSKKKDTFDVVETNASAFQSAKNRQDSVLERVRKNQERLRQQKSDRQGGGDQDEKKDSKKKQNDIVSNNDFELEFYDEDDEGYEGASSTSFQIYNDEEDEGLEDEAMDFYDNIISPTPVGGPGSSRAFGKSSDHNNNDQKSGFFFNKAAASEYDNDVNEVSDDSALDKSEKKKKRKEKKVLGKPMLDEDGNEMYLSLDQATIMSERYSSGQNDEDGDSSVGGPSWDDIGITNEILKQNLAYMNCLQPLSVQDKACPSIVTGNDVLVSTHTGSGKTLAFLAPLAQRILFDARSDNPDQELGVKVIIVAPGRELASQIVTVARELFQGTELTAMLAIGGTPFSRNYEQIRKKKPSFLIGTPGRIAELVVGKPGDKSGKLKIANLQTIVLDECDALLEYEPHREPTAAIMDILKRRHRDSLQSILCSATAGDLLSTSKLDGYLRETYVHARSDANDLSITAPSSDEDSRPRVSRTAIHGVVHVEHQRFALDMLRKILYTEPSPQQVLVFVDNARRVGVVVDKLAEMDIIAAPLHGGQGSEKGDRAEVNKALRDGFVGIVVATEMAARGIDAPYLTHVINLDLPTDASHYAHRAGRCGRGGRPGVVVNVAVGKREEKVPYKFAKSLNIQMYETEPQAGKLVIIEQSNQKDNHVAKDII